MANTLKWLLEEYVIDEEDSAVLRIRAKKAKDNRYAANVDYDEADGYADVLNMLCAINEDIITTLYNHQPEGTEAPEKLEEEAVSERSCENCVYEYVCDWYGANEDYSCKDWLPDLSVTEPREEIT